MLRRIRCQGGGAFKRYRAGSEAAPGRRAIRPAPMESRRFAHAATGSIPSPAGGPSMTKPMLRPHPGLRRAGPARPARPRDRPPPRASAPLRESRIAATQTPLGPSSLHLVAAPLLWGVHCHSLSKSALKNSIPSRARVLSASVPFPRLEIPSGYSSVRKPKFALEISCRPLESDLFNTLSVPLKLARPQRLFSSDAKAGGGASRLRRPRPRLSGRGIKPLLQKAWEAQITLPL